MMIRFQDLSPEQLAGQRLMVGFDGTELNPDLKFQINTVKVGGVILFARNIETPNQIRSLCRSIQEYAQSCGQPPLFIAVDQEGGVVARLKSPFTEFPGNPFMQGTKDAVAFAEITARELIDVGFNMNMAPVMDVAPPGFDSVNARRIFGHDPAYVAHMGCTVIHHLQKNGMISVAKHFPGIGRTTRDSHHELPTMDEALADISAYDLVPFNAAIKQHVAGIMLAHIRYSAIDPNWPASLSPKIAGSLLRQQLGYRGLVMTDDLDMGAISHHYAITAVIQQLLNASVDIALICHAGPKIEGALDQILKCTHDHPDLYAAGRESVRRIAELKNRFINAYGR